MQLIKRVLNRLFPVKSMTYVNNKLNNVFNNMQMSENNCPKVCPKEKIEEAK